MENPSMKSLKLVFVLLAVSVFVFACKVNDKPKNIAAENTNAAQAPADAPAAPATDELATGGKLYKQNCAVCHKPDGTGGEVEIEGRTLKVEDLTTEKMKEEPDEEYIEYMVKGIPSEGMPSFKDELSRLEMEQIVKFIRAEFQK